MARSPVSLGAHHPRLKTLRLLLRDRAARRDHGLAALDSPLALAGALDRGAGVVDVFLGTSAAPWVAALADRAVDAGAELHHVDADIVGRVADVRTAQGLLAIVRIPPPAAGVVPAIVAVEVGDPGNLGTLIRSAEAAGFSAIFTGFGSVDAYNPKVIRASAGAVFGVQVVEVKVTTQLEVLRSAGALTVGLAAREGPPLDTVDLSGDVVLVLGHETRGLAGVPTDAVAHIPMVGATESLNLAVAGSIAAFEVARQRRVAAS
jgi:tRNA G18 (ribose-2'-O)-methylase SpoU